MLSPIFPWESRESYEVFCVVQKAAEVKAELLQAQLVESDGRVIALEAELEELRGRLGQTLDFVGACGSFLAKRLDNVPCRVRGVVAFSVRRGAAMALLVGELQSGCSLREVVEPPSTLIDEG